MVNNNGIPFEVKKPFETVYELKNETPSFEEFMKTYESDGKLNYDDLKGGGLGEAKVYGPCHRDCGWANPKCQCYISVSEGRYVPLYIACPVPKKKWVDGREVTFCTDKTPGQWYHRYCRGHMYINVDLNIKCMKCEKDGHMRNWKFACSDHPADYDWASRGEFYNAAADALNSLWSENDSYLARQYIRIMIDKVLVAQGLRYE